MTLGAMGQMDVKKELKSVKKVLLQDLGER